MNNFIFILLIILSSIHSKAQILKVAILDFENTSGIAKYDGLGKAMSSMLITDIESNVSSKRLQLVERAQIQKILKEQNFQTSSAVDKTTTVKAGKILGVKYLLVGDIYILNDVLVINARLTDTETGDIKFSKKQEGKLSTWLMLKTNIAKELALSISMPFTEPNIPDKEMNVATITTFGNAVVAKDEGKIEKAEELLNTVQEFSPDFKYLDDLKIELDKLKNEVRIINSKIEVIVKNPIELSRKLKIKHDTTQALKVLNDAINMLSEVDPYKLNKKIYLLNEKAIILIEQNKLNESKIPLNEMRKIEPFFMRGIMAQLKVNAMLGEYNEIYKLQHFIIENQDLFYTKELNNKSNLVLDIIGNGYEFKSGYKAEEFLERDQYDLFIPPFEFSNYVVSEMCNNKNINMFELKSWWNNSVSNISDTSNYDYLVNYKPFHLFVLYSNLLWASAKFNPNWGLSILTSLEKLENHYQSYNLEDYKITMKNDGFKPKDPFFTDDRYKDAFFKDWDFLNFKLNQAHIYYLNKQENKAYEIYCNLRKQYDPQYIIYASQLVKDYKTIILKDWIELNIRDDFKETLCK